MTADEKCADILGSGKTDKREEERPSPSPLGLMVGSDLPPGTLKTTGLRHPAAWRAGVRLQADTGRLSEASTRAIVPNFLRHL